MREPVLGGAGPGQRPPAGWQAPARHPVPGGPRRMRRRLTVEQELQQGGVAGLDRVEQGGGAVARIPSVRVHHWGTLRGSGAGGVGAEEGAQAAQSAAAALHASHAMLPHPSPPPPASLTPGAKQLLHSCQVAQPGARQHNCTAGAAKRGWGRAGQATGGLRVAGRRRGGEGAGGAPAAGAPLDRTQVSGGGAGKGATSSASTPARSSSA